MKKKNNAKKKIDALRGILKELKRVVVAYSGGVDSTFLLAFSIKMLGRQSVLAVTAASETYPQKEKESARVMAASLDARHQIIHTSELGVKNFRQNPVNRCYYCKKELFEKLKNLGERYGIYNVVDGSNADDLHDVRFGMHAARELGVRSPLAEAGFGKALIRKESKKMGLATWKKPAFACLASRFPHGERISRELLAVIDKAEDFLRSLGFRQVRVRVHSKNAARIELERNELERAFSKRAVIVTQFRKLGFLYVALDLEGYISGSMNRPYREALEREKQSLLTKR